MPYLLVAPAIVAAAALVSWGLVALGLDPGRLVACLGAWGALAAVVLGWAAAHAGTSVSIAPLGYGGALALRLDALTLAFQLALLVPAALLLTLRRHSGGEAGLSAAAVCAALVSVEAADILLTAFALGAAASLARFVLRLEGRPAGHLTAALGASLALAWAGVVLEVSVGTATYAAIPVAALAGPVFALIAIAALVTAGTLPWRTWLVGALAGGRGGGLAAALLLPLGLYILARAYAATGGEYPSPWVNVILAGIGAATVLAAAARAQAAADRASYLAEAVLAGGGFALIGIGLGTPLGLTAGISAAVVAGVTVALLTLAPEAGALGSLAVLGLAAGIAPGLTFGARLISLQAGFEARDVSGFLALAAAVGWAVLLAGGARALRLKGRTEAGSRWAFGLTALALLAGTGLGLLEADVGEPAMAAVTTAPGGFLNGAPAAVATAAGTWASLGLGAPLLAVALITGLALRLGPPGWRGGLAAAVGGPVPGPLFEVPWRRPVAALAAWARDLSQLRPARLERFSEAMARGPALFWVAVFAALAIAVTR
ncbi:MAG: hypothetical protein ACREPA_05465 [Candidatus Dormibacteraceae bacterium]